MLMARCKKLLEENEQLGKLVSSDNVAKLEGEIVLQNRLLSNVKDAQKGRIRSLTNSCSLKHIQL
jgi:hypothetical protein